MNAKQTTPIIVAEVEENQPWVLRHPSTTITIMGVVLVFAQWAGTQWIREFEAPQWRRVHKSIERIATYQLEQDRHMIMVLDAIAKGAGVSIPKRPVDLDRSAVRVRDDMDGKL